MKSVLDDVGRNERQIIQARMHWAYLIPLIMFTLLWEIAFFGAFISVIVKIIRHGEDTFGVGSVVAGVIVLMLLGLINLLIGVLRWRSVQLLLTDKVLYGRHGFFWTSYRYIPTKKISYIFVYKHLLSKLFGFGTIVVATSGGRFKYRGIANPEEFRALVLEQVKHYEEKD